MRRLRWLIALIVAAAVILGLRLWVIGTVRVAGSSMSGTLRDGDVVVVTRFDYTSGRTPGRTDVVQCRFPDRGDTYIKRVVGLPGDEIVFSDGDLYVNGALTPEPYVSSPTDDFSIVLGEDEYLALGDNRAQSYDSRMADMGSIGSDEILARVRWIIWPVFRIGPVNGSTTNEE